MLKEITSSKSITIIVFPDLFGSGLERGSLFGTLSKLVVQPSIAVI
ncbi:hypothetical protein L2729_07210 [Shewanella gelidimarina]|nr:hypothetical protein [Shewanella gelidimarina]MCL1057790.1 hypothetical protein [Shewanella gelidimarina]